MNTFKTFVRYSMVILTIAGISSCSKDDTTPPSINLIGDNPYTKTISQAYAEPGYTANDDEDGDITSQVTVNNNVIDSVGSYSIDYSVTDAAGNIGSASRTVIVENAAKALAGTYSVVIVQPGSQNYNYSENIIMHNTVDNRIVFSKFGDYNNNTNKVYANVTQVGGTFVNITIPSQTVTQIGQPPADRTFSGSGTISQSGGITTITITVTETIGPNSVTSTYTYTKN